MKLLLALFLILSLMYHPYALLPQSEGMTLSAEQQNVIDNMMQDSENQNLSTIQIDGDALPKNDSIHEFLGLENTKANLTPQQQKSVQEFLDSKYGKITVLNQQSYPIVGEYWTTQFVTSGTHDLIITAINDTSFWGSSPDISFVELYNGNTKLVPLIIDNKIIFPDYSSDGTGYLKVKVHTTGVHNLKLEFGSSVSYANNNAYPTSVVEINDDTANGPTLSDDDTFGRSVANIGDLDRDGINDIAVGAANDDAGAQDSGAIHIIFLNADGTPKSTVEINDDTANGPTLSKFDYFGYSVANFGVID